MGFDGANQWNAAVYGALQNVESKGQYVNPEIREEGLGRSVAAGGPLRMNLRRELAGALEAHADGCGEASPDFLDACLSRPDDIPIMSELIRREILYRVVRNVEGARLRAIATVGEQSHRTANAISPSPLAAAGRPGELRESWLLAPLLGRWLKLVTAVPHREGSDGIASDEDLNTPVLCNAARGCIRAARARVAITTRKDDIG